MFSLYFNQIMESTALDPASVRALQTICLRLERLASGGESSALALVPISVESLALLAVPVKDNADQDDLARIADHYICRIEVRNHYLNDHCSFHPSLPIFLSISSELFLATVLGQDRTFCQGVRVTRQGH